MRRLALAATLLVALGCAREPAVPTWRVEARDFTREIVGEGYLKAEKSVKVTAPTDVDDGLHLEWIIADGAPVAAGDVVARFDASPWRRQLESAQGDRAGVDLSRDSHRVTRRVEEHDSEIDVGVARSELAHAERFQEKDALVFSRNERIESQLDADLARRKEEHALDVRGVQVRILDGEGRLIDLEGQAADQKLGRAEKGLAALAAVAPAAGLAVLVRNWRGNALQPGDTVWPGQAIAEIPELARMQAEVLVLEADAGGLAVGQEAVVRLESRAAAEIPAKIERVDKVAKPRVRNVPVQYFGATLSLAPPPGLLLKPGQRVVARIRVVSIARALVVPRTAVFEEGEHRRVFRRVGDRFEPVEVEVAATANGLAALAKGVAAGDEVALVDPRAANGERKAAGAEAGKGSGG